MREKRNGSMDNIQKLIIGSLGLVGLIVMIVPNSDPLASKKAEAEGAPPVAASESNDAAPSPQPVETTAPDDQTNSSEFVVDDYDISSFGQPMVDPTPPGQRNQATQQQGFGANNNQFANGQGTAGQPQIVGTDSSGPAGPPPPPPITGN
jgi:hypothetical protein